MRCITSRNIFNIMWTVEQDAEFAEVGEFNASSIELYIMTEIAAGTIEPKCHR